jgi:hypothetical protein
MSFAYHGESLEITGIAFCVGQAKSNTAFSSSWWSSKITAAFRSGGPLAALLSYLNMSSHLLLGGYDWATVSEDSMQTRNLDQHEPVNAIATATTALVRLKFVYRYYHFLQIPEIFLHFQDNFLHFHDIFLNFQSRLFSPYSPAFSAPKSHFGAEQAT